MYYRNKNGDKIDGDNIKENFTTENTVLNTIIRVVIIIAIIALVVIAYRYIVNSNKKVVDKV